ncbi:MAG: hypothetical protein ACRENE_08850 [Polyangiaceae bacterium]
MRPVPYVLAALLAGGIGTAATTAFASSPEPALAYQAPDTCPSRDEFERRTQARLHHALSAETAGRHVQVVLARKGATYEGRVTLVEPDGRATTKTLEGSDCDGVVDALSLVAALALEPGGAAPPPRAALPAPAPPASSPAATPSAQTPSSDSAPLPSRPLSRFELNLGGTVAVGVVPSPLLGATLGFDWVDVAAGPLDTAFGLAITASLAPDVHPAGGTAHFAWITLRPLACPFGLSAGRSLAVRGCATGDFGLVVASGEDTVAPATSVRQWGSLGGSCRLETLPRASLRAQVEAGVQAPLRRDRYAFGPNDFFQVPVAIFTTAVSLAVSF